MIAKSAQISPTAADSVYQTICENIISAKWAPGKRLVHRQLAKEFGTSNIPVVEALRRLESDGLVTSYPNAGRRYESGRNRIFARYFLQEKHLKVLHAVYSWRTLHREKKRN